MVNRVADKESAKSILKHNGNQAAMIGMEILYTIISTLTVTSMMAAFSAAAVRIYVPHSFRLWCPSLTI